MSRFFFIFKVIFSVVFFLSSGVIADVSKKSPAEERTGSGKEKVKSTGSGSKDSEKGKNGGAVKKGNETISAGKSKKNEKKRVTVTDGGGRSPREVRAGSGEEKGSAIPSIGVSDPKAELAKMKLKEKLKKEKFRKYGIELRGGGLFVPEFLLLGLFFDEAEGMANGDFGLAFVLRSSRSFEFVFGINYHLFNFYDRNYSDGKPIPRVFLDKGDPAYEREFVKNTLSYMSIDVRFQKLFFLHERFQILVGGGVGLGIVFGEVWRQDTYIPNYDSAKESSGEYRREYLRWKEDPETNRSGLPNVPCSPPKAGEADEVAKRRYCENFAPWKEDRVPPVIPTVDLVLGLVFPVVIDRWDLRIQGGMGLPRFFWIGMGTHIYF